MVNYGWFGKYAGQKEYISQGINGSLPTWLKNWVEQGHDLFVSHDPGNKGRIKKNLRFFLLDQKAQICLVGILENSTDSEGRFFPAVPFITFPTTLQEYFIFFPVLLEPLWNFLRGATPDSTKFTESSFLNDFMAHQEKNISETKKDLDDLLANLTLFHFCSECGMSDVTSLSRALGNLQQEKKQSSLSPWSLKNRLPEDNPLFFACIWLIILDNIFSLSYFPHSFIMEPGTSRPESFLFFRWPLKKDFLALQGIETNDKLTIDILDPRENKTRIHRRFSTLTERADSTLKEILVEGFK